MTEPHSFTFCFGLAGRHLFDSIKNLSAQLNFELDNEVIWKKQREMKRRGMSDCNMKSVIWVRLDRRATKREGERRRGLEDLVSLLKCEIFQLLSVWFLSVRESEMNFRGRETAETGAVLAGDSVMVRQGQSHETTGASGRIPTSCHSVHLLWCNKGRGGKQMKEEKREWTSPVSKQGHQF